MKQKPRYKGESHDKDNAIVLSQFSLDILAYLARSNPNSISNYDPEFGIVLDSEVAF